MRAEIRHVAIVADRPEPVRKFYAELFGMKGPDDPRRGAGHLTDGYVDLLINGRSINHGSGINHWGLKVDDVDAIQRRLDERYPAVSMLTRPVRGFAEIGLHDPFGNTFDLARRDLGERSPDAALAETKRQPRFLHHMVLRTVDAPALATFYADVLGMAELERPAGDSRRYLSGGGITFVIEPWTIADYEGMGVDGPRLDHLGFRVESMDAFMADLDRLVESDPTLAPKPFHGEEGERRRQLLARCRYGQYHLADPDGVLLDVSEG